MNRSDGCQGFWSKSALLCRCTNYCAHWMHWKSELSPPIMQQGHGELCKGRNYNGLASDEHEDRRGERNEGRIDHDRWEEEHSCLSATWMGGRAKLIEGWVKRIQSRSRLIAILQFNHFPQANHLRKNLPFANHKLTKNDQRFSQQKTSLNWLWGSDL